MKGFIIQLVALSFLLCSAPLPAQSASPLDVAEVRSLLAHASGGKEREDSVAQLREFAEDAIHRRDLLRLAGHIPSPDAQEILVDVLSHQQVSILRELSAALKCGDCPLGFVMKCYEKIGTNTIPYLLDQAKSTNRIDRLLAAKVLGMYGDADTNSLPVLHGLTRDADAQVAVFAIISVKQFGPDKKMGGNVLKECLNDGRQEVRIAAINAVPIVAQSHEGCAEELLQIASSANCDIAERKEAIITLGRLQLAGRPLLYLTESIQDTNAVVRAAAMRALSYYRSLPMSASEQVMASLRRGEVHVGAITALATATTRHGEAMPLVVEALSNSDVHIRREAAAFLAEVARTNPSFLNSRTVHTLLPFLKDTDPVVRKNTILTVRDMIKDDDVRAALREMARNEENKRIRALAAKTLEAQSNSGDRW